MVFIVITSYSIHYTKLYDPNGSRIKLGYCDNEQDVYRYQGQEYDVIGLEEATQFTESQMQFISTCNRSVRTDFTPRMYYTCNPRITSYNVCYTKLLRMVTPDDLDRALTETSATAALITSPNAYGFCADVAGLSQAAHKHGALLMVDGAHGAHYPFSSYNFV